MEKGVNRWKIADNDLEAQETVPAALSQDSASVVYTPSF